MSMETKTKDAVTKIFEGLEESLIYLYGRWQDEKQYEDWNDYVKYLQAEFDKVSVDTGACITKVSKRPFGCTFDIDEWSVVFKLTATQYRWSGVKK